MMSDRHSIILVSALFFAASLVAFVVLNRWVVTEIGLLSYGRIWQLYASYSDFGFVRRALVGTILSESGINSTLANEYHFALAIHHIAIAVLASSIAYYCISRKILDPIFVASIAFSPALIIHSGYSTGSLDVFVIILATINILFVRNIFLFSVVIITGILTHELFLFTVPAQLFVLIKGRCVDYEALSYRTLILPGIAFTAATVAVIVFGTIDISKDAVEQIMRQKIPIAADQHGLWSGYVEMASPAERNVTDSLQNLFSEMRTGFIYLIIPLIYIALLIARLWSYSTRSVESVAMIATVIAPLLTALVATDYYRWVAMSANMAILLTIITVAQTGKSASRWNMPLLLLCVFAPFGGAAIDRPFPMHQYILEKFL